MIIPFIWMLSTALKDSGDIFKIPPVWIPRPVIWDNFVRAWTSLPFDVFTWNSFKIAILATLGTLISCSWAAYAFARLKFPYKDALFTIILATMMIPGQITMIPIFILMRAFGWYDTHYPIWVPHFFGSAFGTFLLRQFFLSLPEDLDDAARIDGCNPFQIYWRIYLPLSKPALATLAVLTFLGTWNNLLGPVIYLKSVEKFTLMIGLAFFQGQYVTDYSLLMAGSIISIVPIVVIYMVAQKYFVQGIALTGIKG
ncbi:MAG: carbohydrate ABC transporter permease [Clostridiales bacterium]|nr:carbohydrate ABC transporter permease [Clostridiales bacterium]